MKLRWSWQAIEPTQKQRENEETVDISLVHHTHSRFKQWANSMGQVLKAHLICVLQISNTSFIDIEVVEMSAATVRWLGPSICRPGSENRSALCRFQLPRLFTTRLMWLKRIATKSSWRCCGLASTGSPQCLSEWATTSNPACSINYMWDLNCMYRLLTTYEETIFIRRQRQR